MFKKNHENFLLQVSNRPEIHSNNYHICFDGTDKDHVGYVCPMWLDDYEPLVEEIENNNAWTTCIRLNLKTDEHIQEQIKQKFDNISPKLLLFLHRLKSIEINFQDHCLKTFTRYDHSENIIELSEYDGKREEKNYWLVIKKSLSIPETLQVSEIPINSSKTHSIYHKSYLKIMLD